MKVSAGKVLAFAAILMMVVAPAMADQHLNETDDSEIDGTDNSTELLINQSNAEETARQALSDNNWTLEDSSVDEENGYYKFEFTSGESEAEVRVDGSSGEIFRQEEEHESSDEDSEESGVEELERVEVQNLEQARERINELRTMVMDLRRQVAELEAEESSRGNGAEVEIERDDGEVSVEGETPNGTEFEAESERGPNENAEENINGTPGSEQAQQNRPGFVSRMLSGFFG